MHLEAKEAGKEDSLVEKEEREIWTQKYVIYIYQQSLSFVVYNRIAMPFFLKCIHLLNFHSTWTSYQLFWWRGKGRHID